jgi:hypothetical protein
VAWHDGRSFYACHCGARDERTRDAPPTVPCWNCKGGIMAQWVPPAVAADRFSPPFLSSLSQQGESLE